MKLQIAGLLCRGLGTQIANRPKQLLLVLSESARNVKRSFAVERYEHRVEKRVKVS
jgi:hypothetical protein